MSSVNSLLPSPSQREERPDIVIEEKVVAGKDEEKEAAGVGVACESGGADGVREKANFMRGVGNVEADEEADGDVIRVRRRKRRAAQVCVDASEDVGGQGSGGASSAIETTTAAEIAVKVLTAVLCGVIIVASFF